MAIEQWVVWFAVGYAAHAVMQFTLSPSEAVSWDAVVALVVLAMIYSAWTFLMDAQGSSEHPLSETIMYRFDYWCGSHVILIFMET